MSFVPNIFYGSSLKQIESSRSTFFTEATDPCTQEFLSQILWEDEERESSKGPDRDCIPACAGITFGAD